MEITALIETLSFAGDINIPLVIGTSLFVMVVKQVFKQAKVDVPSWVWLVAVLAAGFCLALFDPEEQFSVPTAIINAATASYAYTIVKKVFNRDKEGKDQTDAQSGVEVH
jgi:hypothetical protein